MRLVQAMSGAARLGLFDFGASGSVTLQAVADGASYSADAVWVRRVSP
jgi:hypothetical protein